MRPLALILLLLVASRGVLCAQEQESGLTERLLHPNMSLGSPMQNKTFYSGGGGVDTTKSANVKDFYIPERFFAKSFETREFETADFWQGNFQFATKAAAVKADSEGDKVYATKAAAVKEALESGKTYATQGYATHEAVEKGKISQQHLDEIYKGKAQMNMDDVRDLLNKSHTIGYDRGE
jgi:hypothetical protein